jgi:glycosyltransferase involved in cell wall biosynthesis
VSTGRQPPLTVVVVHNHYQLPGGEDEVFRAETELLESRGHRVVRFTVDNHSIKGMGPVALATTAVWSRAMYRDLRALFRRERPDVAHFHNTQPLVSPSAYYAARSEGVAVVQSLHNFRLACVNGVLFRDGHVCEDCLGKRVAWPGVVHACYRGSVGASGVTAAMVGLHRMIGTWRGAIGAYIALSEFSRKKFIEAGLPGAKVFVKPNFLPSDPGPGEHGGQFGLYVGRISPEKGLGILQQAWEVLGQECRLKVIGGPVPEERSASSSIEWLGPLPKARVFEEMKAAAFLVFPSECYENCPMTIIEAYATGLPVIVSGKGSAAEMVHDGRTGWHFRASDPADLAATVRRAVADVQGRASMGQAARREFESRYCGGWNYTRMMEIYRAVLARPAEGEPYGAA